MSGKNENIEILVPFHASWGLFFRSYQERRFLFYNYALTEAQILNLYQE
jgi:hypothetical protein